MIFQPAVLVYWRVDTSRICILPATLADRFWFGRENLPEHNRLLLKLDGVKEVVKKRDQKVWLLIRTLVIWDDFLHSKMNTSWWFQIFFVFIRIWGRWSHFWRAYFSDGLKPPTRWISTTLQSPFAKRRPNSLLKSTELLVKHSELKKLFFQFSRVIPLESWFFPQYWYLLNILVKILVLST